MTYEDARDHIKYMIDHKDKGLTHLGDPYVGWDKDKDTATLDGQFTWHDLMAIAIYMRDNREETDRE